jgi:quinol monooxygenase YgiN
VVRLAVVLSAPVRGADQLVHFEPGCLGCRVSTEFDDKSFVRYEEEWATEEAMRLHVRSARFTRLLEVLESAPEPPEIKFDFVSQTRGLDYVEEVRMNDGSLRRPDFGTT